VDQKVVIKTKHFSHVNLLKELIFLPKDWHNFLRMNEFTYLTLLSMVSPLIQKKHYNAASCNFSQETYSHFKIFGDRENYEDLTFSTKMSPQALEKIIPEICRAIYKVLKEYYNVRVHRLAVTPSINFAHIFLRIFVPSS
jgi:hypothetical protein